MQECSIMDFCLIWLLLFISYQSRSISKEMRWCSSLLFQNFIKHKLNNNDKNTRLIYSKRFIPSSLCDLDDTLQCIAVPQSLVCKLNPCTIITLLASGISIELHFTNFPLVCLVVHVLCVPLEFVKWDVQNTYFPYNSHRDFDGPFFRFGNTAYLYISVAFIQMLKALSASTFYSLYVTLQRSILIQ
jgi:hypothetical protein